MPIGIMINVAAVVLGGISGSLMGDNLPDSRKSSMEEILGLCALCMGIGSVVLMQNMPAVVFSVICGTLTGMSMKLGVTVRLACEKATNRLLRKNDPEANELLLTAVVLFCTSSTGIYGALDSGMSGNHTVLITKAVLDFFTAMIFGCRLKNMLCLVALPQGLIQLAVFGLAGMILPLITPQLLADFKACGGFLLVATGLRMMKLKLFPVADMIPALVLVMPVSYGWSAWLLLLLG